MWHLAHACLGLPDLRMAFRTDYILRMQKSNNSTTTTTTTTTTTIGLNALEAPSAGLVASDKGHFRSTDDLLYCLYYDNREK